MWPWKRAGAKRQDDEAEERLRRAEEIAAESLAARAKVRGELRQNHFTELFQQALQRRQA